VLRIEDLDTPRVKAGAVEGIERTLRALGIDWDEGPLIQSHDLEPYRAAMRTLASRGLTYPSPETRGELEQSGDAASAPQEGVRESVFPASRRPSTVPSRFEPQMTPCNWRLVVPPRETVVADRVCGERRFRPADIVGDFVIWTKRDLPAYQLAVVVDDARQGITDIVRGDDLLESAARQRLIIEGLGLSHAPDFYHLPLVRGDDGKRLAKRHGDTRVDTYLNAGVSPERLIGLLAEWSGIAGERRAMSAAEFRAAFDLALLPRYDVTFRPGDDAWLRQA
jgi:glutamyl-tRNA synthetase